MTRNVIRLILLVALSAIAVHSQPTPTKWPTQDGTYVIKNFRFGTGETLPALKPHSPPLRQPPRDAAGHTHNAILPLPGPGGAAHSLLNPVFSDVLFGPG